MGALSDSQSQTYASALLTLGHGYPLWIPEPNNALSTQYKETGVRIGDVGVLADDGGFDFIFNVCCAADDPVNQFGVPLGFQPLSWDPGSKRETPKIFRPQHPIASKGAKQRGIAVEGLVSLPYMLYSALHGFKLIRTLSIFPIGGGGGIKIEFSEGKGAVIMPPNGADRADCLDFAVFREYAQKHATSWYEYINGTLGREVDNGALYFITGIDKTDCWENAVVKDEVRERSCELIFTTSGLVGDGRLRLSTSSMCMSVASRCSPEGNSKQNQALFVRGFRIAMRRKVKFFGNLKVEVRSTKDLSPDDFPGRRDGNAPFSRNRSTSNGAGPSSSTSSISPSTSGRSRTSNPPYESDDSGNSSESHTLRFYHPLNSINDSILSSYDTIELVITHDDDWMGLLRDEDIFMPDDRTLLDRFQVSSRVTVSSGNFAFYVATGKLMAYALKV
ncbi:SCF ubiquitin ligase complex subunit cdc4, partial [Marasmius crinis-equi]